MSTMSRMPMDEALALATRMREAQVGWSIIARVTGHGVDEIRRRLDPEYVAQQRVRDRQKYRELYTAGPIVREQPYRINKMDALRALANVPRDTRSLTGRAFGDPLPGRSALDKRKQAQAGNIVKTSTARRDLLAPRESGVSIEDRQFTGEAI